MKTYDTTFTIKALAAHVWEALTDFPRYDEWNSAVPSLSGDLRVASTLAIQLDMAGKPMNVTAEVQEVDPEKKFSWRGHLGAEFLFTGIREFTLEALGTDATSVRHYESIRGLLVPPFLLLKSKALAEHHHGFNESLTKRAEELASQSG